MVRLNCVRGFAVSALLLIGSSAFASPFTSTTSGDWGLSSTWGGVGVPGAGDTVTITSNHVVTVSDPRSAASVTLDSTSGNKMLVVQGTLSIQNTGSALTINAPVPGSTNIVRVDGGMLDVQNGGIAITGGVSTAAKLEFTSTGGTAAAATDVLFSGTIANAVVDFGGSAGTLQIGGNLGSGGTLINLGSSVVELNGAGAQTINAYTFSTFFVNKPSGTATLNGAITVNGNLTISQGVLDDGGNQITLNGGGTSVVQIGASGVLKLGSAATATTFPTPVGGTIFSPNSAVVYQSGQPQFVNSALAYERLFLTSYAPPVTHSITGTTLQVNGLLMIQNNGGVVTFDLGTGTLDANGDIGGDGNLDVSSGSINVAGNFNAGLTLNLGTSTVTYDGTGAQNVAGAPYYNLTISKPSGIASLSGSDMGVQGLFNITSGSFDAGTNTVTLLGDLTNNGSIAAGSATFRLNGTAAQTWSSIPGITLGSLEINNSAGASIGNNVTVNGSLVLNGGIVTVTGSFTVDVLATVTRTSGWLRGPLTMGMNPTPARTFHVGTAFAYLPVDVDAGSAGLLTVQADEGQHPNRTGPNLLQRYWTILAPSTVTPIDTLTFHYANSDFSTGIESKFHLAQYSTSIWTQHGDVVDETGNTATLTNVSSYLSDWVIGQRGSLGAAGFLAFSDVNGGTDPTVSTPFDVTVDSRYDDGSPANVVNNTPISLAVFAGAGPLGGTTTGTINAGSSSATINGVTYGTAESGVVLRASATGGDPVDFGDSTIFNVGSAPSTITVTSLADSGAGTLRDAITSANTGACTAPCTIDFSVSGTIALASPLPAITLDNLTIDGTTAPGSSVNTNAFGQPSNAVLTIGIDGSGTVSYGFDISATFVKITGFSIRNFGNAGVVFNGDNSGSRVSGCHIGVDGTGATAGANAIGVLFNASTESNLGGLNPADRNLISGNTTYGVKALTGTNTVGIIGNYIGTNRTLTAALPNVTGIYVGSGASVSIGDASTGNVISGNSGSGIVLAQNGIPVKGNLIGPAGNSTVALPNATGIQIDAGSNVDTIGGTVASERNVISGNTQNGILSEGDDALIDGNWIGLAPDGTTSMPNTGSGIRLQNDAARNLIGTNAANKIVFNGNDGVTIATTATGIGNVVRQNKIAGNTNRAIDIDDDGTTANDATDADTGANDKQNFPVIADAKLTGGSVSVKLSLDSSGGVNANFFRFDVYKADASTPAQALEFLGDSGCLAGNVFANATFTVPAGTTVVGNSVVATATAYSDAACNTPSEGTSELSASARVNGAVHWIAGTGNWETAANWSPAIVPTTFDDAYIDNNGTYTVTINSIVNPGSLQLGAASGTQTLVIPTSQSMNLNGTSSVGANGVLQLDGIGLAASGGLLTVNGLFQWSSGSLSGAGGVTIGSGGTLNINGAFTKSLIATLLAIDTGGTANWNGGTLNLASGAAISNLGTFECKTDATINDAGSAGAFTNNGTFRKSTTSGTTLFSNVTFNHAAGTMDVQTGTVNLAGGTASAPIAVSSGAEVLIDDNTWTLATGASQSGAGKIHVNGGTLAVNATSATIEHLALDAGTLSGTGIATTGATGTWLWNGGTMSGSGTTQIAAGGALTIATAGAKALGSGRTLSIQSGASATWSAGTINIGGGASIANAGTFDNTGDTSLSDTGANGGFSNTGLFKKSAGSGTTSIVNVDVTNSGTIDIQTGTLNPTNVTSSNVITIGGTLVVDDGTFTLTGASDVSGAGQLQVLGGTLTVNAPDTLPNVRIDSGTLNGTATFSINNLTWNGGTMSGSGTTTIPIPFTATIATASAKSLQRTLSVAGGATVNVTGSGTINMSSGGNVSNLGTFDFATDASLNDAGSDGGFANSGTLRKSAGAGSTSFVNVDLTNSGTLQVQSGTFNPGNVTNSGPITISSGTFLVDDSTVTLSAGTDVTGAGLFQIVNGTVDANANDTMPNVRLDGGTLQGSGPISLQSFLWNGGTMGGSGTTSIPAAGTATISTASAKTLARTFSVLNSGTATINGTGALFLSSGGNINNAGLFDVTTTVSISDGGSGGDIANSGTFRTSGNVTLGGITLNDNAPGTIDVQSGTLDIADGTCAAAITIASGATFLVNSDNYILAAGTSVTGAGTLSLTAGTLTVNTTVSVPNFAQSGGALDGTGSLNLTGTSSWSGGTMQGSGSTGVNGAGTLAITTPSAKTLNRLLFNTTGTINLNGVGTINIGSGGLINNAGVFNVTVDSQFNDAGSGGNFTNTGTFRKQTATGPTIFTGIGFTNNGGLVDLQSGTLNVNGDFFMQTSGTLRLWLNGTTPGTGFAQVSTNQTPSLAGTLDIQLVGPYQPVGGDTFRVLSAAAHTGDFTHPYSYPALANSRTFSDAFDGSGLLLTVNGNADLAMAKSAPVSNVLPNAALTYSLVVTNNGPDVANGVVVTDNLPAGHTGISASGTGWNCNVVSLAVTCSALAPLPTGAAPTITVNANAPSTPQTFINYADVTSSNDSDNSNNQGNWQITVDPLQADVEVTATSPASPVAPSTAFTFDFTVRNNGPQTATNVTFTAPIPASLSYTNAVPDSGTCNFSASVVTCNLGSIVNGGAPHVVLSLSTTTTTGTHSVTGTAAATESDPIPSNNSIAPSVSVTGSTITVINTNDSGAGSLRQALDDAANGICTPLPCTIAFNIGAGPFVIAPATALPSIGNQTLVDATTQPGYSGVPIIQIDGTAGALFASLQISGNNSAVKGLSLTGSDHGLVVAGNNNTVESNYLGMTPAGVAAPNIEGIEITGNANTVGSTNAAKKNVISGNSGSGVYLTGSAGSNAILGNFIGTNAAGNAAVANNIGIAVTDEADSNTIGGATAAEGNLISGNFTWGVYVEGGGTSVAAGGVASQASGDGIIDNTLITNNRIGPNAAGTAALGGTGGVYVYSNAKGTTIGGSGQGNVISGHAKGIYLNDAGVTDTVVDGNLIGVAPDGTTPMANTIAGIYINAATDSNIRSNTIAHNGDGVVVLTGADNAITTNSIFLNTGLGIDLADDGATPNDATDADSGPNGLQNAPTLTAAQLLGGGDVRFAYNIDSSGATPTIGSIRFDFFEADASGQGQSSLGFTCVAGNAFGVGTSFNAPSVAAGDPVVMTATAYSDTSCSTVGGGTSEFSNVVTAALCTPPPVTITGPTTSCGGAVTLDAGPGFASYSWSTGATTQQITVSPASTTTYTVTVTDGIGCPNSDTHTVNVSTPPAVTITGPTSMCATGSVTLDAGAGFASYSWSTGATTQQITVSPASTTTYTVTVSNGTCSNSDSHTVNVTANPTVTITGPTTSCGGPVTLDAGPGFVSYSWSTGATTQQIIVSPASPTTYSVTVSDGTCTATDTHTVTPTTPPPASITPSGPTTFCAGGSVTLTASAGTSWLWSNGAVTQSITVTASGSFSVQVYSGSCSSTSAPTSVTVNPAPAVTITGPTATCGSAPVTLDAGPGFASYSWSTGATTQQITVSPTSTTTYSVTVSNGTCSNTDTHTVAVSTNPTATINAPAGVCWSSSNNHASVAPQAGASYTWTIGNGTITAGQGTNNLTFTAGNSGTVTLGITVTNGTCTSTGNATVAISQRPSVAITAPSSASPNQSGLVASVPFTAGATYNWSVTNGTLNAGQGTNSITFTAGASGTTDVHVTATNGACSDANTFPVTIDAPTSGGTGADLRVTKSAPATAQPGATITYTIGVTNLGPEDAAGVVVSDTLPFGTSFVSVNSGAWNCSRIGSLVRCMGVAPNGASSTIDITVTLPQSGTITNTVQITSAVNDPNAANDFASATTTIVTPPPVCATTPPSLVLPVDHATVTSPVTFSWSTVSGATEYELWIDGALAGSTTATSLTRSTGSGTFAWFVVARLASGCEPLTSAQRVFTVLPGNDCATHTAATITSPPNSATTSAQTTFTWTPVANAIGYRLWIESNGTAAQDAGTTIATSLAASLAPGTHVAYVDALFASCPPVRSASISINVPKPDPCATRGTATPVSPANNAVLGSSSVAFTWLPAPNAAGYRVWISANGAAPSVLGTTVAETSLDAALAPGSITWFVEALYPGCASTSSQALHFTIPQQQGCGNERPTLLAPANGSQAGNANVTFAWSPVPNAIAYELWVRLNQGTAVLFGTTDATTLTRVVPPGKIDWYVRAIVERCPSRNSLTSSFTSAPPAQCATHDAPIAIEPLDGAQTSAPVTFTWSAVDGATSYDLYVVRGSEEPALVASTDAAEATVMSLANGKLRWFVRAQFGGGCPSLDSAEQTLEIVSKPGACSPLAPPTLAVPGQISSGKPFLVQWTPSGGATAYQLELANNAAFNGAEIVTTTATQHALVRTNNGNAPLALYARVRAVDTRCQPVPSVSAFGPGAAIFILPSNGAEAAMPLTGAGIVTLTLPLGSELAGQTFTATPKQPWLSVAPSSGVVAAGGTNLIVTADANDLPAGTSLGSIAVTLSGASAGSTTTHGSIVVPSNFSVTLVTPVTSNPKDTPPPDALIIPAIAHADGINSHFQSDVRVSNTSPRAIEYQLTFTPSGDTGITQGSQTTFTIGAGQTIALDDILRSWFGNGSGSSMGTLEIRPLTQTTTETSSSPFGGLAELVSFAASRTFNTTANGTYGQFIPAIPFANFVGRDRILSLQQIAQSPRYRTNFGLVEGSGNPADLVVRVFGQSGAYLTEFPISLRGGQHLQLNAFLRNNAGIDDLTDGRVEVEVTSGDGKVTAYASVLDNTTSDPLLVTPVAVDAEGATKWVVPGVADLLTGFANWQTDMRLFNAGATPVEATLAFYSQSGAAPKVHTLTIDSGEVKAFDKVLSSVFATTNDGGAVHVSTASPSRLIATARTYNQTSGGTYGQFISAVTPAEAAGVGSRPLQLLQVEESDRFRSNIGITEVTGNPVKIEISAVPPDAKFTAVTELELKPNEFRQLGSLLKMMGLGETFNARVTVRAIEGTGRVTAYASVIDMQTNDPTYVPAQ